MVNHPNRNATRTFDEQQALKARRNELAKLKRAASKPAKDAHRAELAKLKAEDRSRRAQSRGQTP